MDREIHTYILQKFNFYVQLTHIILLNRRKTHQPNVFFSNIKTKHNSTFFIMEVRTAKKIVASWKVNNLTPSEPLFFSFFFEKKNVQNFSYIHP